MTRAVIEFIDKAGAIDVLLHEFPDEGGTYPDGMLTSIELAKQAIVFMQKAAQKSGIKVLNPV